MTPGDLSKEVRSTLYTLRQRGYLLAIGSSSKNTRQILRQLGLGEFFDAVADGTMITRSKPDPEVFLLAASMLGCGRKMRWSLRTQNPVSGQPKQADSGQSESGQRATTQIRTLPSGI